MHVLAASHSRLSFVLPPSVAPPLLSSCCRCCSLFGSLPEYIYTLKTSTTPSYLNSQPGPAVGIYVDLYADSNITFEVALQSASGSAKPAAGSESAQQSQQHKATVRGGGSGKQGRSLQSNTGTATLTQSTAWPYDTGVSITLLMPASSVFDVALRIPSWVAAPTVAVTVNGVAWPVQGVPGTYLHLNQTWPAGPSSITYSLPMAFTAHNYTGHSQLAPFTRWGYTYGPILLAAETSDNSWNSTYDTIIMPQGTPLDPQNPQNWMTRMGAAGTSQYLWFNVTAPSQQVPAESGAAPSSSSTSAAAAPGASTSIFFKPYYAVQGDGEMFTVYPCF